MKSESYDRGRQTKRKLAALMSADVVGYSRLMGDNDEATLHALTARRAAIEGHVEAHGGRIVNFAGDAILAEFPSAIEAVRAAISIQIDLRARNEALPPDRRMLFRIGINLGDVIEQDDGTVYGDGVNIAARMEALADPGGICVSNNVRDFVDGHVQARFDFLGEKSVKNIAKPVGVYRIDIDGTAAPRTSTPRLPRRFGTALAAIAAIVALLITGWALRPTVFDLFTPPHTAATIGDIENRTFIAVLPFADMRGDDEQAYFSHGVTEDIIGALGRYPDLAVIASNAVSQYKGTKVDLDRVATKLGVQYLLTGNVRRGGERLRISVELTEARRGLLLWSQDYDAELADVFNVQKEITQRVAATLVGRLTKIEQDRAFDKPTKSLEAYDYALHGWAYLSRYTRAANEQARKAFEQALTLDRNYASAYVGLGQVYQDSFSRGWTEFLEASLNRSEELAREAIAIDDTHAEAYRLLGEALMGKGDYAGALNSVDRAVILNPSHAESHAVRGTVRLYMGDAPHAIDSLETALKLDPNLRTGWLVHLALAHYVEGHFADALKAVERSAIKDSSVPPYYRPAVLAATLAQLGEQDRAAAAARDVRAAWPFFRIEQFTAHFVDAEHRAVLDQGLQAAGLE